MWLKWICLIFQRICVGCFWLFFLYFHFSIRISHIFVVYAIHWISLSRLILILGLLIDLFLVASFQIFCYESISLLSFTTISITLSIKALHLNFCFQRNCKFQLHQNGEKKSFYKYLNTGFEWEKCFNVFTSWGHALLFPFNSLEFTID